MPTNLVTGLRVLDISPPHPGPALRYYSVMPIADLEQAAQKIAGLLSSLNKLGGMRLKYRITAGDGARDPEGLEARQIYVELGGPDVPLVTQHNGELLADWPEGRKGAPAAEASPRSARKRPGELRCGELQGATGA